METSDWKFTKCQKIKLAAHVVCLFFCLCPTGWIKHFCSKLDAKNMMKQNVSILDNKFDQLRQNPKETPFNPSQSGGFWCPFCGGDGWQCPCHHCCFSCLRLAHKSQLVSLCLPVHLVSGGFLTALLAHQWNHTLVAWVMVGGSEGVLKFQWNKQQWMNQTALWRVFAFFDLQLSHLHEH